MFTAEFARLQRDEPANTKLRESFLLDASWHFPSRAMLESLYRRGCDDADAKVRRTAMECVTEFCGPNGPQMLNEFAQHSRPEVRDEILQYLQTPGAATKQ